MNIATKLTVLRIVMVPFFMYTLYLNTPAMRLVALVLFIIASLTDFLDGYLARKLNQVTNLGKILDPAADKILVTAALIGLVELAEIPSWIVTVMISREFFVSLLRIIAAKDGTVIAAGSWGKAKTIVQMVAIILLLAKNYPASLIDVRFDLILIYIATILAVVSGIEYFYKNKEVFKS